MGKTVTKAEADHIKQLASWTRYAKQSGIQLSRDAAEAARLHMSYGNYMAAVHDGRIKRERV